MKEVRGDASEKARALMLAEDFPETCRVIHEARETLDGPLKGCRLSEAHGAPRPIQTRAVVHGQPVDGFSCY